MKYELDSIYDSYLNSDYYKNKNTDAKEYFTFYHFKNMFHFPYNVSYFYGAGKP